MPPTNSRASRYARRSPAPHDGRIYHASVSTSGPVSEASWVDGVVAFPGDPQTVVTGIRGPDGDWVVSLRLDGSLFAEGPTFAQAAASLVDSAREDLRLLEEHDGNLAPHLETQLRLLRYLFR